MSGEDRPDWARRFPSSRPEIEIHRSQREIGTVDCRELLWWFVVPEVGKRASWASYEIDTLELAGLTDMVATMPARVAKVDCVEIEVREWSPRADWRIQFRPGFMYGRIGADRTEWVAIVREVGGQRLISTLAERDFRDDWAVECPRRLRDDGRFQEQADGSYKHGGPGGGGAGVYDVRIGRNTYSCLRVLDFSEVGGELAEAYIAANGRTVFFRRYDGRFHRGTDLVERYPGNRRIVIDGVEYVHGDCTGRAHDIVTSAGLGLAEW